MNCKVSKLLPLLLTLTFYLCFGELMAQSLMNDTQKRVTAIANQYEQDFFTYNPELALFWGKKDIALDRFNDHS